MAYEYKNILVNRIHDAAVLDHGKKYLRGRLIDIGCGTKPYAQRLSGYITEHVGVDHADSFHDLGAVNRIGTAYTLPADDASFDSALCTAGSSTSRSRRQPFVSVTACSSPEAARCTRSRSSGTCTRSRATSTATPSMGCATCSSRRASRSWN